MSEFVLNTTNKTPVCILHEYAQIVLKTQPTYTFDDSGKLTLFKFSSSCKFFMNNIEKKCRNLDGNDKFPGYKIAPITMSVTLTPRK